MRFGVLGPVSVEVDGVAVSLRARMQRLLLATLLTRVRKPVSPERLIAALWPECEPDNASKTLQIYVHRLRKALGDTHRVTHGVSGYTLVASRAELDWQRFEDLLREARQARALGELDQSRRRYESALALWRGEPYADVDDCPELLSETERLSELRFDARVEQAEVAMECGAPADVLATLRELNAVQPYREEIYRLLMLAHYRQGRPAEALQAYRRARKRITEELGIDLGAAVERTHRAVLNRDPALTRTRARSRVEVAPVRPAQLPPAVSAVVGRRQALDDLTRLADGDTRRVVGVVDGMAGVGKTTVAISAANQLTSKFPDGQMFVDLHGFTSDTAPVEPAAALAQLLHGMGISTDQLPEELDARAALWRSCLRDKRILILLDNAVDAAQIRPLLPSEPKCLVLITSRMRLTDVDESCPLTLEPLNVTASVELFTRVAGPDRVAEQPSEALSELVSLCGGLPLALRLAAARFRDRPDWQLRQLTQRLRHSSDRLLELDLGGRRLDEAFTVGWRRLDADAQRMFRLLGSYPGVEFDAHAAAAMVDVDVDAAGRTLEQLVDAHMLESRSYGKYRHHVLLRQFAARSADQQHPDSEQQAALERLRKHRAHVVASRVGQPARLTSPDAVDSPTI